MNKFKSVGVIGVAIVLCAGCHAMEAPQADVPVLIEPDVRECSESDPECRVADDPVALDTEIPDTESDLEPAIESDTETSTEPIQGIISLDELKAHDQNADSGQQDGDQSGSGTSDASDNLDSAPNPDGAICYYDHEDQPVYRGQVEASCAVHFPDDPTGASECVSDHCD